MELARQIGSISHLQSPALVFDPIRMLPVNTPKEVDATLRAIRAMAYG